MVALLREGKCQIDTVAAVTFTRKAAAELRARFQVALERETSAAEGAARQRLKSALDNIDRCFTGTIHSFLEGAGASPVEMADLLLKEAWVLCRLDNVNTAVSRARQALAIYREHKGERHPCTLQAGYQLGRLLVSLCHLDEAAPLLEGLVMARREMLGEDHPDHAAAESPPAWSCTQATLLYLPRSMATMVVVDADCRVVVFMLASSSWGLWGLFAW
jgi:UvrD/REP helicase N-terminal domain/Tetratricopeptide repeat